MIVWESHFESGQMLDEESKKEFYTALLEYLFLQKEPCLEGAASAVFTAIRPNLDKSRSRAESGRKGGICSQAKRQANAKQTAKQTSSKPSSKTQANAQANDDFASRSYVYGYGYVYGDKESMSEKSDEIPYDEIVGHLNEVTGSSFRSKTEKTRRHIRARFADGFTKDDFFAVIDKKASEWGGDPKMSQYLRPETLFGSKFEGYLNQPSVTNGSGYGVDESYEGWGDWA